MLRKNGSHRKGIVGIFFLSTLLVIFVILIIAGFVWIRSDAKGIKYNIDLAVQIDDRGSWSSSFLKTTNNGKSYMETLGSSSASNYQDYLKADLESLETSIKKSTNLDSKQRLISIPEIPLTKGTAKQGSQDIFVNIPIPGGGKLKARIVEG